MTASKFEDARNAQLASDEDVNHVHTQKVIVDGVVLSLSDIEIGAVEIKDSTTNDRVHVSPAGLLSVDASSATVPISAVALPLPSGAATSGNQATEISAIGNTNTALGLLAKLTDTQPVSIAGVVSITFSGAQPVTGPLTDTQLRATPVPISGVVTAADTAVATNTAPTYIEGSANAESQDLNGNLRVRADNTDLILRDDRRLLEMQMVKLIEANVMAGIKRAGERTSYLDRRGFTGKGTSR